MDSRSLNIALVLGFLFAAMPVSGEATQLSGKVKIDGSSTVFPVTEAVAEEFGKQHGRVRVTVGVSGTGGGFKKFTAGETDICDASRKIKDQEAALARKHGIDYLEIPVAYDGISIIINKENTWVDHLTTAELKKIWQPNSNVQTWKDIRPTWPAEKIKLYGPGTDSGTFDYFTETVNGKSQVSRSDFTKSEDDNVLVKGVAGDKYSLGYFGFAYYIENSSLLKAVPIKHEKGIAVMPSQKSINDGSYQPLSRPIFIYVSDRAVKKPEVVAFVEFYIANAAKLSKEVGYVPLPESMYAKSKADFAGLVKK